MQKRAMKVIKARLEILTYKGWLKQLGFFTLVNRFRGDHITVFQYL